MKNLYALVLFVFMLVAQGHAQKQAPANWTKLFNGKDLTGWGTYLYPSRAAADQTPIGLNKDPHGVFKAEDGMIHVSGQDWGGVFTNESYSNYHLRFQVKFGTKKWAPRLDVVADGGLLFHCSLPYNFGSNCWMRSIELQIQESDIGDYHNVGAGIPVIPFVAGKDGEVDVNQYDAYGQLRPTASRVYRSGNFESKSDAWTTSELVARGADAVFIVNGFVVNRVFNIYRQDLQQQTTAGQLEFQSEGAEHFIRNIEIRGISNNVTGTPKLISNKPEFELTPEIQTLEIVNQGDAVELIAAELMGRELEQYVVKLPQFPLVLKKGEKLSIPVSVKQGSYTNERIKFRLETLAGPVKDFFVFFKVK